MGIAHSKVPHSTWESLGKTEFFWSGPYIAMTRKMA